MSHAGALRPAARGVTREGAAPRPDHRRAAGVWWSRRNRRRRLAVLELEGFRSRYRRVSAPGSGRGNSSLLKDSSPTHGHSLGGATFPPVEGFVGKLTTLASSVALWSHGAKLSSAGRPPRTI